MKLHWSEQSLFDLDWMYEGVYAACRDYETTDRYYDGMIAAIEAKQSFPQNGANGTRGRFSRPIFMRFHVPKWDGRPLQLRAIVIGPRYDDEP